MMGSLQGVFRSGQPVDEAAEQFALGEFDAESEPLRGDGVEFVEARPGLVGEQLGRGRSLDEIRAEMNQVAEGVKSAPIVCELAAQHGVYMPIAEQMRACVQEGRTAMEAYRGLVRNPAAREIDPD